MADTVGNAAIGSVLSIDDGFLKKLEAIDNKIKDIQKSSSEMASSVEGNFKMLATGSADAFLKKLVEISSAMDGIGNGVGKIASSGFGTATSAATGFGTSVAGVASQVDRVAAQLRAVGGDGAGALMSARANAEQFANAMKGFDTTSIAKLKENIKSLSEDLTKNDYPKAIQQQKVEILKLLQEELRVAMMTQAKREANQQQSLDRMIKAEEAYQKRLAAQQKKTAEQYKAQNYSQNTSYEGSLAFAENVGTMNRRAKALEYLKVARAQLSAADADYTAKLERLNTEIERLDAANKNAMTTQAKRDESRQRQLEKSIKAEEAYQKKTAELYKKTAEQYKAQNYARNTTYEGSLSFAETANTINRRVKAIEYLREARARLSTTDADYTKKLERLNAEIKRLDAANKDAVASSKNLKEIHSRLLDTAGQLKRAFALIFSVSQIRNYISSIAQVRGEFELQQRSLQALLGDTRAANAIFNKTVALAVQSPYQIKDLVSYTKQLAAYRIEQDKLYDTTKRLADVSAGLGVDMQRIILAYGQVKAAAYLRGCLGYNTPIRMYDGSIKMVQDVQVGDVLINENGEKVNVKELIRGREKMYIINQLNGNDRTMYKVNANHILTLWNVVEQRIEDIYLYDYLKDTEQPYLGVKVQNNGERFYYAIGAIECGVDNYYGFVLDGNKRFLLGDGTITHNTEVRQFTEAGINLYGELQRYFQEVKGEAYTTAQIVDMISKRKVTFEDIEAIFKRMTDQGGMFYNMQAIQAETLQGKIANLKDSIDVMLNGIGKQNEWALKGAVSGATALLSSWESITRVGTRLLELLVLIKITSMQTGVTMKTAFLNNANFVAISRGMSSMQVAVTGLRNGFTALAAAGKMAKAALVANLPLFAAMEAISVAFEVYGKAQQRAKEAEENLQGYARMAKTVNSLTREFRALAEARKAAEASNDKKFDFDKNFEEQKAQLRVIQEELKKYKLSLNVEINKVTTENISDVVEDARRKMQIMNGMMYDATEYISKSDNSFLANDWLWFDSFSQDLKDMDKAAADVRSFGTRIDATLTLLGENYDILSEKAKKAYDGIRDGAKDTETDTEYIIRAARTIATDIFGGTYKKRLPQELKAAYNQFASYSSDLRTQISGVWQFESQMETATGQIEDFFDWLESTWGSRLSKLKPAEVKVFYDKVAEANSFSDLSRSILMKFAQKKYGFKIEADKDEAENQVNWIDKYIKDYFAGKRYPVTISLQTNTDMMEDFIGRGDNEAKVAKTAKTFIERFSKSAAKNLKSIAVSDKVAELFGGNIPQMALTKTGEVQTTAVLAQAKAVMKKAEDMAKALGVDVNYDDGKKTTAQAKEQRDLIQERIQAYKELRDEYAKYLKLYDAETAKAKTLEGLADKLRNAGIYDEASKIVPDGLTIAEKIKALGKQYKELSKRGDALKVYAELILEYDMERNAKALEKAKSDVEKSFSGFDVFKDMKDMGFDSGEIDKIFGDLPRTFDDIKKSIDKAYEGMTGEDAQKQRLEAEKKLSEKIRQQNLNTIKELTKAYKTQLSDQLKIDRWYYEERAKILSAIPQEMQREYLDNLDKQYAQKTDENAWKEFKESDYYIKLFESLDSSSSRMLEAMKKRLGELRGSLKNLSPEQLKQVVDAMEKVDGELVSRNPFARLGTNIKEYIRYQQQRKKLEEDYLASVNKESALKSQSEEQQRIVMKKKEEYETVLKTYGKESDKTREVKTSYDMEKMKLDILLKELVAQGKITEQYAEQVRNGERAKKNIQQQASAINDFIGKFASGFGEISGMLEGFGVEVPDSISKAFSGMEQASGGIAKLVSGDYIGGVMSLASGIGNMVSSFLGGDAAIQKRIEEHQRTITRLQWAYDDLKEAMDNAWSSADLILAKDGAIDSIEKQNEALRAMINAEDDKKQKDTAQIEEWTREIEENTKKIQELKEQTLSEMGGFGSQSNYKSAAQEFADAWVDAFNEDGDALDALGDKFDDFFDNLIKKQLMQRGAKRYLEPILKAFDDAVSEGSAGGNNGYDVTKEELDTIAALRDQNLMAFNEYAKTLMDVLGVVPDGNSELSALQQGIQGLTESTGQALEGLLNSIRYFVARQADDVQAIRSLLNAANSLGGSQSGDTAVLVELRTQTTVIREIRDMLSDVTKSGHPRNGRGIKVFVD